MNKTKIAYKPLGTLLGMAAGAVAGLAFERVWRMVGSDGDPPRPTDEQRHWGEIIVAAALQGAIFAVVKAAVDRGGAQTVRRLTGHWPG